MKLLLFNDIQFQHEIKEFCKILGPDVFLIPFNYSKDHEFISNLQKDYDVIYSHDPNNLFNLYPKIPYFYDILPHTAPNELMFNKFKEYYTQLQGAKAVFTGDKKLNKYAEWLDLNTYWITNSTIISKLLPKKFLTPDLHILFNSKDKNNLSYNIVKQFWKTKKSNWHLHIYGDYLPTDFSDNVCFYDYPDSSLLNTCHIILDLSVFHNNTLDLFPSSFALKAMNNGCVLVSTNLHGNNTNIIFDEVHYFRLDPLFTETLSDLIRNLDKRREKLQRVSLAGYNVVKKYFNVSKIVSQKLRILNARDY